MDFVFSTVIGGLQPFSRYVIRVWPESAAGRGLVGEAVATTGPKCKSLFQQISSTKHKNSTCKQIVLKCHALHSITGTFNYFDANHTLTS